MSKEIPGEVRFRADNPGAKDCPGWQSMHRIRNSKGGQLQEFIGGNEAVGGFYVQTYVLRDESRTKILHTIPIKLSRSEYLDVLREVDSPEYRKRKLHELFRPPQFGMEVTDTDPVRPNGKPVYR